MRGLRESERRRDRDRSGPHERSGHQGNGPEDHGLLGDTALFWHHREYPDSYHRLGEQGFSCAHGIDLQELVLLLQGRFRQQDVSASRLIHPVQVCTTVARPLGCGKMEM
jgi:hypothetical protein